MRTPERRVLRVCSRVYFLIVLENFVVDGVVVVLVVVVFVDRIDLGFVVVVLVVVNSNVVVELVWELEG